MTKAVLGVMLSCLASCCSTVGGGDQARKMPEALFLALKGNDPSAAMPYIMTKDRYETLSRGGEEEFLTAEERRIALEDAAVRSETSMRESIRAIHAAAAEYGGFDWERARLESVWMDTVKRDGSWVIYDPDVGQARLDVCLFIVSGDWLLVVKLNDCFPVCGRRYMGDGMILQWAKHRKEDGSF